MAKNKTENKNTEKPIAEKPAGKKLREVKVTGQQLMDTYRNDQIRLEELEKKGKALQKVITEMISTLDSVKEIKNTKEGENTLILLGAGIYVEGKITNTKTLKNSLAGKVLINTDIAKVLTSLDEDLKKAGSEMAKTQTEMQKVQRNLQMVSQMMQKGQQMMQENPNQKEQASDVS